MKIAALEDFLRNPELAGSQSFQLLQKFLLFSKLVQDPLNVFRYMEEKSIGIYYPLFWFSKSQYLAEIGDYRNSFLCLREAQERKPIDQTDESAKILNTKIKAHTYKDQISNQMLKYPPNKRRTVSDFNIITKNFVDSPGNEQQKNQKLFNLLQTKFTLLRIEKEKAFQQKNQDKPKSWLFQNYETQQKKTFKMHNEGNSKSSVAKTNQNFYNQERMFRSVNTPFKRRDPMRMIKTVDSVEMMKRKRRTDDVEKRKNPLVSSTQKLPQNLQEDQNQNDQDGHSISINTVPVGRALDIKKRQVKFQKQQTAYKIEKPRDNNHMAKEDDIIQVSRKTSVHNRKGILRNKSIQKKQLKFTQITERSLLLKKTEQNDV